MESRSAWTDARLDDRFDHIDGELSALRTEMRAGFDRIDSRFADADRRIDALGTELRGEIGELRTLMIRFNGGMLLALFAAIAAIFVRGG
jgi:hypothetical protein